jgi:hypothetical protein
VGTVEQNRATEDGSLRLTANRFPSISIKTILARLVVPTFEESRPVKLPNIALRFTLSCMLRMLKNVDASLQPSYSGRPSAFAQVEETGENIHVTAIKLVRAVSLSDQQHTLPLTKTIGLHHCEQR